MQRKAKIHAEIHIPKYFACFLIFFALVTSVNVFFPTLHDKETCKQSRNKSIAKKSTTLDSYLFEDCLFEHFK